MNYAAGRSRYVDDTVSTASPAKLLTMLYDRLVSDLQRAEAEQQVGDRVAASAHLVHAQEIVHELAATLDIDAWDGAARLMSVYMYLITELVNANVSGDPERTAACRELVEPLRDAWHQAAREVSGATPLEMTAAPAAPRAFDAVAATGSSSGLVWEG